MKTKSVLKNASIIFVAFALVFGLYACGSSSSSSSEEKLSGTVSTNGSTSMEKVIGVLGEAYMQENSDVKVTYDATGSGTGIESVKNGSCDLGLSSRALKDTETGLKATTVALDGIAIIVNENCGVDNLTLEQITKIGRASCRERV